MEKVFKFSKTSKARLATCHPALQDIMNEIINFVDIGITCGKRTLAEQQFAIDTGASKLSDARNGKHVPPADKEQGLETYSFAVDIVWFNHKNKIDWASKVYRVLGPAIVELGKRKGLNIRWGGDWDQDGDQQDQTFNDLVHFEIK